MEGKNSQYCADCNEGYYVPYKKKRTECIKCENNCLECFGLVTFSYCYICKEGYEPINGKCEKQVIKTEIIKKTEKIGITEEMIKPGEVQKTEEIHSTEKNERTENIKSTCTIGEGEKCKSCDLINPEFCGLCNEGYYLPKYGKAKCKQCSMKGCRTCPNDICIDCFGDDEINYSDITEGEALNKILNEQNITRADSDRIYFNGKNDSIVGLKFGRFFVWNKYKKKND